MKVEYGRYGSNNNVSIKLIKNKELYMVASVNTDVKLPDNQVAIKNYSENEGVEDMLIAMKVIKPTILFEIPSGFVRIPVYERVM